MIIDLTQKSRLKLIIEKIDAWREQLYLAPKCREWAYDFEAQL